MWVWHPNTCIYVRLLGPCYKTGQLGPYRQHHERAWGMQAVEPPIIQESQKLTRAQPKRRTLILQKRPRSHRWYPHVDIISQQVGSTSHMVLSHQQNRCWHRPWRRSLTFNRSLNNGAYATNHKMIHSSKSSLHSFILIAIASLLTISGTI